MHAKKHTHKDGEYTFTEAYRYLANAKETLGRSSVEYGRYTDSKYVREAAGIAYLSALNAEAYNAMSVILDDVRSNFKLFGEDLSSVRDEVGRIKEDTTQIKSRQSIMECDIIVMKTDLKDKADKTDIEELKTLLVQKADI